jgi:lipoate-protein ligase A
MQNNSDHQFSSTTWRLICSPPAVGAWNMAVDEALLATSGTGEAPPALRLYSWQPACLSLGLAQPFGDIDAARLTAHGWGYVRRPTGGRAILHTDELTYSVTGPYTEPRLAGSVLESYLTLSKALVAALSLLDVGASIQHPHETGMDRSAAAAVCFEVPSTYEITFEGRKLIGSAQARRKEGILQHGSLPLIGDLTRITQVLSYPDESARAEAALRLREHALTTEESLGREVDWDTAAAAFAEAFTRVLNLQFVETALTTREQLLAQQIFDQKYSTDAWNKRI